MLQWRFDNGPSPSLRLVGEHGASLMAAERALACFRDSGHPDAATTGGRMLAALRGGTVPLTTLVSFSRWCHTGGAYVSGRGPAEEASVALFGAVLPNFARDQNGELSTAETWATASRFFAD